MEAGLTRKFGEANLRRVAELQGRGWTGVDVGTRNGGRGRGAPPLLGFGSVY